MNTLRICVLLSLFLFVLGPVRGSTNTWIASWAASPQSGSPNPREALLNIDNQTVRERVRISMGGSQIQLRFSNEFGSSPLVIGSATVAIPTNASSVEQESIRSVTFEGHKSVTIPAGAPVLSDPITFPVIFGAEISVSIYFPKRLTTPTLHAFAFKHAVISQHGDFTHAEKIDAATTSTASISVTAVFVPAQASERLVVAFGDSITDGDGSTVDADKNWPSDLIRRAASTSKTSALAVVNEGIVGNRLLRDGDIFGISALARFDRDALVPAGVTHIVLLEGLNDICFPGAKMDGQYLADPAETRSAQDITDAYRQLISRAHARGIKVIGATITPCEGVEIPGYYSEAKEETRQTVNKWIRTSGAFDGIIDFDAVVRDPKHPSQLLPKFTSKDHLHPNDEGYKAMAASIDLNLFK
ncbi:MAG TPA: SGNH/GDSL hydrolase family protein [Candidatus Udaeobacter sp.]|nr:MAG: esterase [Verrucomicrobiota bacterium]HMC24548.1 SGNH/GDSL hydrolase family protein [Candidatus Udaeobacter sp.]